MAIYLSFLVPKIIAIVHPTPTKARPTPSAWNHEHNRLSDFIPIASLLEWQWHRGMVNFTTLLETELVAPRPSDARVEWPGPPRTPTVSRRNYQVQQILLKDPVRRAGSTQMQTRSYHARQSGNLARKVRNAFPGSTALTS